MQQMKDAVNNQMGGMIGHGSVGGSRLTRTDIKGNGDIAEFAHGTIAGCPRKSRRRAWRQRNTFSQWPGKHVGRHCLSPEILVEPGHAGIIATHDAKLELPRIKAEFAQNGLGATICEGFEIHGLPTRIFENNVGDHQVYVMGLELMTGKPFHVRVDRNLFPRKKSGS